MCFAISCHESVSKVILQLESERGVRGSFGSWIEEDARLFFFSFERPWASGVEEARGGKKDIRLIFAFGAQEEGSHAEGDDDHEADEEGPAV